MSIVNGDDFDRTLPESNCSHVSGKKVLAPYVQQNEKCMFQAIGENEVGDDVQDFPHSPILSKLKLILIVKDAKTCKWRRCRSSRTLPGEKPGEKYKAAKARRKVVDQCKCRVSMDVYPYKTSGHSPQRNVAERRHVLVLEIETTMASMPKEEDESLLDIS